MSFTFTLTTIPLWFFDFAKWAIAVYICLYAVELIIRVLFSKSVDKQLEKLKEIKENFRKDFK